MSFIGAAGHRARPRRGDKAYGGYKTAAREKDRMISRQDSAAHADRSGGESDMREDAHRLEHK